MDQLHAALEAAKRGDDHVSLDLPQATEWDRIMSRTKIAMLQALGYKLNAIEITVRL